MVNVSADAKPIKMANSNTPIDFASVFIYIRFRVPQSASWLRCVAFHVTFHGVVTQESSAFPTHMKIFVVNIEEV